MLKHLIPRLLNKDKFEQANELFEQEHTTAQPNAATKDFFRSLRTRARQSALLDWGPAALKLIDRDQWIGWDGRSHADRRDLIVQKDIFWYSQQHDDQFGRPLSVGSPNRAALAVRASTSL